MIVKKRRQVEIKKFNYKNNDNPKWQVAFTPFPDAMQLKSQPQASLLLAVLH